MNSPRDHRFVIRLVVNAKVQHRGRALARGHDQNLRMRSTKIAQYKKIMAFHAGGNTSCGRGMRNYHSTNSGLRYLLGE